MGCLGFEPEPYYSPVERTATTPILKPAALEVATHRFHCYEIDDIICEIDDAMHVTVVISLITP